MKIVAMSGLNTMTVIHVFSTKGSNEASVTLSWWLKIEEFELCLFGNWFRKD